MDQIELGWTTLPQCTRVRMKMVDGPSGSKLEIPDGIETAEQRLYAYLDVDSPNWTNEAQDAARNCAVAAIAAAGGIGLVTANAGAAASAFGQAFLACFTAKVADVAISSIKIETSARCMW